MSPQKVVNALSGFYGFLDKIMPAICLAIIGGGLYMWVGYQSLPKTYASIPAVNDVILKVGLMEKDVGTSQKQLDRIEGYLQSQQTTLGMIQTDIIKLKFSHGSQFRNK